MTGALYVLIKTLLPFMRSWYDQERWRSSQLFEHMRVTLLSSSIYSAASPCYRAPFMPHPGRDRVFMIFSGPAENRGRVSVTTKKAANAHLISYLVCKMANTHSHEVFLRELLSYITCEKRKIRSLSRIPCCNSPIDAMDKLVLSYLAKQ